MPWHIYRVVLSGGGGEKPNRLQVHQRSSHYLRPLPDPTRMFGLRLRQRGLWGVGRLDQPRKAIGGRPRQVSNSVRPSA
jgi:hypothetical protein